MANIQASQLRGFAANALRAAGVPSGDAVAIAELIVEADLAGADAHGLSRLPQYVHRILTGGINAKALPSVVAQSGSTALVDGDNGMGHLVVKYAVDNAISIARGTGVAWVGIRRSNHAGAGRVYAALPAKQDMIGIYCAVGNANHMAPWGGLDRLLSTNPIAIAIPAERHPPLVLDMATSAVSFGTVKQSAARGEPLPEGWMIDSETGESLVDASRHDQGLLLPFGGYKGYGLSVVITILAGILNGAAGGSDVIDFNVDEVTPTNTGQLVIVADIRRFMDVPTFKGMMDRFIGELRDSRPLPHGPGVRVPGQNSAELHAERSQAGLSLPASLRAALDKLATEIGIDPLAQP